MLKLLHSSVNHPKTFATHYRFPNLAGSPEVPCKQISALVPNVGKVEGTARTCAEKNTCLLLLCSSHSSNNYNYNYN